MFSLTFRVLFLIIGLVSCKDATKPSESSGEIDAIKTEEAPKKTDKEVKVSLPEAFISIFNESKIKLSNHMQLEECPKAIFKQKGNSFVTKNCSIAPSSLSIDGFKFTSNKTQNGKITLFEPKDILTKEISISSPVDYLAYFNKKPLSDCNISQGESKKSFPYRCIAKPLSFRVAQDFLPCDIKKNAISLKDVIDDAPISLDLPDCYVNITDWPPEWKKPKECDLIDDSQSRLKCKLSVEDIKQKKKEIQFNFGNGWEPATISINISKKDYSIKDIDRKNVIGKAKPIWPFNDKGWQWEENNAQDAKSNCDQIKYAITHITYFHEKGKLKLKLKKHNTKVQLPNLRNMGWTYDELPHTVELTLEHKVNNPVRWKLSEVRKDDQWTLADKYKLHENIIVKLSTNDLNLTDSYLYTFSNMKACKKFNGSGEIMVPIPETLIVEKPCSEAFKFINDEDDTSISRCTKVDMLTKQLNFKPYGCSGKRKLIVVALGEELNKYNNQIKTALINAFQKYNSVPFSLITIQPGRELSEEILFCEDMIDIKEEKRLINKKLRFGARDLDAWQNLKIVNLQYQSKLNELEAIFYITGAGLYDIDNINNFAKIPKKWKQQGVPLTVITTKTKTNTTICKKWHKDAQASCEYIDEIETALENFLKRNKE